MTLSWNVLGVIVLAFLASAASSVALLAFGLDSLIEIGASILVLWELSGAGVVTGAGTGALRQRRALQLIGIAFILMAGYVLLQSSAALVFGQRSSPSAAGIVWMVSTAVVMFTLAAGKWRTGRALANPVLITEGRVTLIDAFLALAVLLGLVLHSSIGWWWADPAAGYVIVYYAIREAVHIFRAEAAMP